MQTARRSICWMIRRLNRRQWSSFSNLLGWTSIIRIFWSCRAESKLFWTWSHWSCFPFWKRLLGLWCTIRIKRKLRRPLIRKNWSFLRSIRKSKKKSSRESNNLKKNVSLESKSVNYKKGSKDSQFWAKFKLWSKKLLIYKTWRLSKKLKSKVKWNSFKK